METFPVAAPSGTPPLEAPAGGPTETPTGALMHTRAWQPVLVRASLFSVFNAPPYFAQAGHLLISHTPVARCGRRSACLDARRTSSPIARRQPPPVRTTPGCACPPPRLLAPHPGSSRIQVSPTSQSPPHPSLPLVQSLPHFRLTRPRRSARRRRSSAAMPRRPQRARA